MHATGYVPLLTKLSTHKEWDAGSLALVLRVLSRCVNVGSPGQADAVSSGATIPALVALLKHSDAAVREQAARTLTLLAFVPAGKAAAVAAGAVSALVPLLSRAYSSGERAEAAGAVAAIAVDDGFKSAFLALADGEGLRHLSELLTDDEVVVRLNAMRAISTVSANPEARTMFRTLGVEGRLADMADTLTEGLEYDVAVKALGVVRWRP